MELHFPKRFHAKLGRESLFFFENWELEIGSPLSLVALRLHLWLLTWLCKHLHYPSMEFQKLALHSFPSVTAHRTPLWPVAPFGDPSRFLDCFFQHWTSWKKWSCLPLENLIHLPFVVLESKLLGVVWFGFRIRLLILILNSHNQILESDYENPKSHLVTYFLEVDFT